MCKKILSLLIPIVCFAYEPATEFYYHLEGDLLWLRRARLEDIPLFRYEGDFGTNQGRVIGTERLVHDLDKQFVPQFTFGFKPNQAGQLEARAQLPATFVSDITRESYRKTNIDVNIALGYFLNANDSNPLPTPILDLQNTDYTSADKAHIHYETKMYDLELNYWFNATPPRVNYFSVAYGLGLRYFDQLEIFRQTMYKDLDASSFQVTTKNHMFGGQGFVKLEVNPYQFLTWGMRVQAAGFGNAINLLNDVRDYNNTTQLKLQSEHELYYGYLGEMDLYIVGNVLSCLNWKIGFQGLWIRGLALAPNNINLTTKVTPINKDKNIIYAAWTVGLGYAF